MPASNRCIAGWPMSPCGLLTLTPPICAHHRALAERAWNVLTDEQRDAIAATTAEPRADEAEQ